MIRYLYKNVIRKFLLLIGFNRDNILSCEIKIKKGLENVLIRFKIIYYKIIVEYFHKGKEKNILTRYVILFKNNKIDINTYDSAIRHYFNKEKLINSSLYRIRAVFISYLVRAKKRIYKEFRPLLHHTQTYYFIYYISIIYGLFLNLIKKKKQYKVSKINNKTIIIYSKCHFNPNEYFIDKPVSNSSTGNLAKNIYCSLSNDNIIYRDKKEIVLDIKDADIVFGIVSKSFIKYCKNNPNSRKILFLVNSHPLFRIKQVMREAKYRKLSIPYHEFESPIEMIKCIKLADKIILQGNDYIKETYYKYGTNPNDIININGIVNTERIKYVKKIANKDEKLRILYTATNLDIRKGFFRIIEIWNRILEKNINNIELLILGRDDYFKEGLSSLIKRKNVKYFGWIDSSSREYIEILQSSHIVLGLSIEEGQIGSVLEAMATGSIPIITKECGISLKRSGYLLEKYNIDNIINIIDNLNKNRDLIDNMSKNVRKDVEDNYNNIDFRRKIKNIVYENKL